MSLKIKSILMASLLSTTGMTTAVMADDHAGDHSGFYGGVFFNPTFVMESDHKSGLSDTVANLSLEAGILPGLTLGYDFNKIRMEVAVSKGSFSPETLSVEQPVLDLAAGQYNLASGKLEMTRYMFNVIKDFDLGDGASIYVGAGVGYADHNMKNVTAGYDFLNGEDGVLSGQFLAGLEHDLSDNVKAGIGYIYAVNSTHKEVFGRPKFDHHGFTLSLRWAFGGSSTSYSSKRATAKPVSKPAPAPTSAPAPKPAPVVKPAPAPVVEQRQAEPEPVVVKRDFAVFFDWDSAQLSDAAKRTVFEVSRIINESDINTVVVIGHADTSGPDPYNDRLSLRRAESVRDQMVANGVSSSMIEISGVGERVLEVQTGDNVRNDRNRRVVIRLN